MDKLIPVALVLGCNTPVGLNPLSDWIEEQTGHAPYFYDKGWSDETFSKNIFDRESDCLDGYGFYTDAGDGSGNGTNGWPRGDGWCYGLSRGDGYGDGIGYGDTDGDGAGCGDIE